MDKMVDLVVNDLDHDISSTHREGFFFGFFFVFGGVVYFKDDV